MVPTETPFLPQNLEPRLAVVEPQHVSLLGGGAFLFKRRGEEPRFLDFREEAPASYHPVRLDPPMVHSRLSPGATVPMVHSRLSGLRLAFHNSWFFSQKSKSRGF